MVDFENYMVDVRSQLVDNATEEHKSQHITYTYSNELVNSNLEYFQGCYERGLSAYKALLFFHDFLNEKGEF
jgi:hypothetical protein